MKQARRVSPRIPYDEAVCLARVDGKGRLFGRSVDLGTSGIYVTCAELCEIGTELVCAVLLPGGPRQLRGRVVRLVALPRAVGIAIAFTSLTQRDSAVIERLIAGRLPAPQPVKLQVGGVDHAMRCEAVVGGHTMRVSTALPSFLRLDADVGVVLGEHRDGLHDRKRRGVISRIALDPLASDGIPRLALDVELADSAAHALGGAAARVDHNDRSPPSGLPRPYGHPLPSVLVSSGFARQAESATPIARPPRRRSHGTAEVRRPPRFNEWGPPVAPAPVGELTQRLLTLGPSHPHAHPSWVARLLVPLMLAGAALVLLARFAH
jgi:PilZ domain